jgi:hypothetical protein
MDSSRGTAKWLAVVVTALVLLLLSPATAAAIRTEFFGIVQGASLDSRDLGGMESARIQTARFLINWGSVQPNNSTSFRWGPTDRLVGRLAVHGIRAVPSLWGNPRWVSGPSARPPLDRPRDVTAWRNFAKAVVARYGRGGSYWANGYLQEYGPDATPVPIFSYQPWNEPNLKKFFAPYPAPREYARLLGYTHDAIESKDPQAQVVLAGMPGNGEVKAWDLLKGLYSAGAKPDFDAAALHPYAPDTQRQRTTIEKFRTVMKNRNDADTPLWLTEVGWGSASPDRFGINKGLAGQNRMLEATFNLVLGHRKAWNVQRLFWYHWRDPKEVRAGTCSFCGSAGLLKFNRTRKPSFYTFKGFTAETDPPTATITAGPGEGSIISDPTPSFGFKSSEPGSLFQCRVDAGAFKSCSSPRTLEPLADGVHTFSVRAIDAPGNVGAPVARSFTVDAP